MYRKDPVVVYERRDSQSSGPCPNPGHSNTQITTSLLISYSGRSKQSCPQTSSPRHDAAIYRRCVQSIASQNAASIFIHPPFSLQAPVSSAGNMPVRRERPRRACPGALQMRSSIQILRVIITSERALGERARPSPSWPWGRARPCHRCSYHLGRAFLFGGRRGWRPGTTAARLASV